MHNVPWFHQSADIWLRHVLSIHFDPQTGTPYWLEQARKMGVDVLQQIRSTDDLGILGPMNPKALATRPVEDFIPRRYHLEKESFTLGDTAGTTGTPKVTAYRNDEFHAAFVEYFGFVAEKLGFPKSLNWLWIGPGGPHIIGKAARMVARRMGSLDPFAIDFDARWIKKLVPGSMGWERYFQHIEDQALHILRTQDIGVLFSTPPVLKRLADKMNPALRRRIKGVHYGGMALSPELYLRLRNDCFPEAVHISGYGNTLFGVCLEVESNPDGRLHYFPPGVRLLIDIIGPDNRKVDYGQRGRVVFSRLDESFLILNMLERDQATRIPAGAAARAFGLTLDGLADPGPDPTPDTAKKMALGLY
ncbi:MAG: hypothetical protein ACOZF0_00240 [Thermodesulfobacteriota bacterium]